MKLISWIFPILLTSCVILTSCKDKLDLTADYKDITISYGVMNINDSIHYFKVYRGFLTDDNALVEAGNWENIYYPVDSIEVRLEEYVNGMFVNGEILDTTTQVSKSEGFFPNPKQLLYYSYRKLNPEAAYRLVVKRLNTGEEVYAESLVVGDFTIKTPINSWNLNLENVYPIRFYQASNAAAYDIYLSFYYIEVNQKTGEIEHKVLTKRLTSDVVRASSSSNELSYQSFAPKTFFTYIAQSLENKPNVVRYIDAIDGNPYRCLRMQVWAVNDVYMKYMDASSPSHSIVQDRVIYTNFVSGNNDAFGFIASRNSCHRDLMLSSLEHNEDTLVKGYATRHLGFDYYRNSPLFLEK